MIVATAGHVDHGKTALVRALTGKDTDTLAEEKRRGLTITPGFAYMDAGSQRIGFVDVPGHERFIHNLLASVTGIDAVLLVIAADAGVMPQTREHLRIMELLGLERGICVITKTDRADAEMLAMIADELRELTRETFLSDAPVVGTAATTGAGIGELTDVLIDLAGRLPGKGASGTFRMPVDRAFTLKGMGVVVTGTVYAGAVEAGASISVSPSGKLARVRSIHSEDRPAAEAATGHRCALNLAGLSLSEVRRGDWLTAPSALHGSDRVDVQLRVPADGRPIRHWTPVHVFHGAAHTLGRVALLASRAIEPGERGLAQLVLDDPIVGAHGDVCILRNQAADQTLGGAEILDVFGPRRGRAGPERLAQLRLMDCDEVSDYVDAWLSPDERTLPVAELRKNWNLAATEWTALLDRLPVQAINVDGRQVMVHTERLEALHNQLTSNLDECHRQNPQAAGLRMHELCGGVNGRWATGIIEAVVHGLMDQGKIAQHGPYLSAPGFAPRLSGADAALWKQVSAAIREAGPRPPVVGELVSTLGISEARLESLLESAQRVGVAVRVSETRYFLAETLTAMAELMRKLAAEDEQGLVPTAAFRDRSGLGRNLSIEVLEHFDDMRLTARVGNARRLLEPTAFRD
jgi:selenocysteine-specific elongation factor